MLFIFNGKLRMHFAIIAAGEGSRLKAESVALPKPLIKINNVPMIDRLLSIAIKNGAESISCITNEEFEEVHKFLRNKKLAVPFNLIIKSTPSSLHSFFALRPFLENKSFCLTTVDTIFREEEFQNFIYESESHKEYDGIIAITDFIDDEKPLCVQIDKDSRILKFEDSPVNLKYATGGLYYFSTNIFDEMQDVIEKGMMRLRNFLKSLVEKNYNIHAYRFSKIIDVDHYKDIVIAEEFLAAQQEK
jgi:NDP-sugar pyrophosphorylase family protein